MTFRTFIRSLMHPLCVTSVEATDDSLPGSIHLCARLCWAAQLAEGEQVEVASLGNGVRMSAVVLIGQAGEVRLPGGDACGFKNGDPVMVRAWGSVPAERAACHEATMVLADKSRNAPIEIRQSAARPVTKEPSYTPPPPRIELVEMVGADPADEAVVQFTSDP